MRPIGLTLKNAKFDRYNGRTTGEIMIVHLCTSCGVISCNRVAGDDNAYTILSLLNETGSLDLSISSRLSEMGIYLLSREDEDMVGTALLGVNFKDFIEWLSGIIRKHLPRGEGHSKIYG